MVRIGQLIFYSLNIRLSLTILIVLTLAVVGHIAIDHISVEDISLGASVGGTVTYTSIAASKIGLNVKIFSKAGSDFPLKFRDFLAYHRLDINGLKVDSEKPTTRFKIRYSNNVRRMWLISRCSPITLKDIVGVENADAVHLGPIAQELSLKLVRELTALDLPVSLDLQGLLRRFSPNTGYVRLYKAFDPSELRGLNMVKLSSREAEILSGSRSIVRVLDKLGGMGSLVAVTSGGKGVYLSFESKAFHIPAYKTRVVDPTGGGDCFVAGLLYGRLKGYDPVWSACLGLASASFVVEGYGPSRFGSLKEVEERASILSEYAKQIRL